MFCYKLLTIENGLLNQLLSCLVNLDKNSQAVKKGAALFKMVSIKKVMKSKLAAKKWL